MRAPPPDWIPGHPGYPLHLAGTQLRAAIQSMIATLELIGVADPAAVASQALWQAAMAHDAERAIVPRRRDV